MISFRINPSFGQITVDVKNKHKLFNNFDFNTILIHPLVNYHIETIKNNSFVVGEEAIVLKDSINEKGILKSIEDDFIDIEIDNVLCRIKDYSGVLQEVQNKYIIVDQETTLNYVFYSVFWKPFYTLNYQDKSLICSANIVSNDLLSGDFTLRTDDDKFVYHLGELEFQGNMITQLFFKKDLDLENFYIHNINEKSTEKKISFETSLPYEGDLSFYKDEKYVGTFPILKIDEDEYEFNIGQTSDLLCRSQFKTVENKIIILTNIKNNLDQELELTLRFDLEDKIFKSSSEPITEKYGNILEWDILVDSGLEKENYEFKTILSF